MKKNIICIVSSSGGHLFKAQLLSGSWAKHDRFWVTENNVMSSSILKKERVYFGYFPVQRNAIHFFQNFFLAIRLFMKEKPTHVLSTGAGIAPPFFLAAKLFGCRTIFIETFIFIKRATLSGRICYFLADHFLVQNEQLLHTYPKALYLGSIL
jgi:beta-1,4-N-acetylglucosaminyltransferase